MAALATVARLPYADARIPILREIDSAHRDFMAAAIERHGPSVRRQALNEGAIIDGLAHRCRIAALDLAAKVETLELAIGPDRRDTEHLAQMIADAVADWCDMRRDPARMLNAMIERDGAA